MKSEARKEEINIVDIEKKLNEIIVKYNFINENQTKTRNEIYLEIRDILTQKLQGKKAILRCAGVHALRFIDDFEDLLNIVAIVDQDVKRTKERTKNYNIPVISVQEIKKIDFDIIVVGTYLARKEVKQELSEIGIKCILDIYEELEKRKIQVNVPYYDTHKNPYLSIIQLNRQYKQETQSERKEVILEKIIVSYLTIRDIWSAQKKIKEYIKNGYSRTTDFKKLADEIKKLIDEIKQMITQRKGKDIIWFWHDALCYDWVKYMPFMCECRENGMFFQNTFTSSVCTRNVYRLIFNKLREIDGYGKKTNNMITPYLKEKGYKCIRIGGEAYQSCDLNQFDYNNRNLADYDVATSQYYWQLIRELMKSEQPLFVLIHTLYETHTPNCSPSLEEYDRRRVELDRRITSSGKIEFLNNIKQTVAYLDEITKGLCDILGQDMTKIFMSDHGMAQAFESRKWTRDSNHFNFIITGKNIPKMKCKGLFDLYNFYEVVEFIFEPTKEHLKAIFTDKILLQAQDVYNKYLIEYFCAHNLEEYAISFRGIQTLEDRYILLATGKEIYNIMPDEKTNYIEKEEYKNRIKELRESTGNHFIDIEKEEKFRYTPRLYSSLKDKKYRCT